MILQNFIDFVGGDLAGYAFDMFFLSISLAISLKLTERFFYLVRPYFFSAHLVLKTPFFELLGIAAVFYFSNLVAYLIGVLLAIWFFFPTFFIGMFLNAVKYICAEDQMECVKTDYKFLLKFFVEQVLKYSQRFPEHAHILENIREFQTAKQTAEAASTKN